MYFLTISLFNNKLRLAAVAASIFYMFNAYNLFIWNSPDPSILASYAAYPLLFALFARGLKSKKILTSSIFFGLGSLIFVTGNARLPFTVLMIFTLVLYFFFHLKFISKNTTERRSALRFAIVAATLYLLVNLWWILPLIPYYWEAVGSLTSMNLLGWVGNFSSYSTVLNLLRLYGYPGWNSYNAAGPAFSYVPALLYNPSFVALSFLPPILIGIALIMRPKIKDKIINTEIFFFALILYILSIFLSKGTQAPFGSLNLWLFEHIPAFSMFRSGFVNFGIIMALSLAILFGISLDTIHKYLGNLITKLKIKIVKFDITILFSVFIIALILISNYPFLTGEVINSGAGGVPSFHHDIPEYYYDAANWINNQNVDFRIFSFYGGGATWAVYNWTDGDTYIGVNIDSLLMHKSIVYPDSTETPLASYVYQMLFQNQTDEFGQLLNLLNVKYVLLHLDANTSWYLQTPPEVIATALASQKDIRLEATFGDLAFYINEDYNETQIYATNQFQVSTNPPTNYTAQGNGIFFLTGQLTENNIRTLNSLSSTSYQPNISFQEINPTKYVVHVNASEPFFLILSDSYQGYWLASIGGQQVSDAYHFTANDYANAWYISKTGTYTVTLEFWPQNLLYAGAVISIITLIACAMYLSKNKIKNIYKKHAKKKNKTGI